MLLLEIQTGDQKFLLAYGSFKSTHHQTRQDMPNMLIAGLFADMRNILCQDNPDAYMSHVLGPYEQGRDLDDCNAVRLYQGHMQQLLRDLEEINKERNLQVSSNRTPNLGPLASHRQQIMIKHNCSLPSRPPVDGF